MDQSPSLKWLESTRTWRLSLVMLFFIIGTAQLFGAGVTLEWDPPTANEDGTPLTDLSGYKVYYGVSSNDLPFSFDAGSNAWARIEDLVGGVTYYFTVTAYNQFGAESAPSALLVWDQASSPTTTTPSSTTTTTTATVTPTTTTVTPTTTTTATLGPNDADFQHMVGGASVPGADWKIDMDEVCWVTEYLLAGGDYHVDPLSPTGYAPGPGSQVGSPSNVDFQTWNGGDPLPGADWKIDHEETGWVIEYWLGSDEYHVEPLSPSGYAPGP